MGDIFWAAKNFFLGGGGGGAVLEIPEIYFGWNVDAGPESTYEKKIEYPLPPGIRAVCSNVLDLSKYDGEAGSSLLAYTKFETVCPSDRQMDGRRYAQYWISGQSIKGH